MPHFPDELFTATPPVVTVEETLTTEPTWPSFDRHGKPVGVPPELLNKDQQIPSGTLRRTVHTDSCVIVRPVPIPSLEPEPVFEFENGCKAFEFKRVCWRETAYFFVHGTLEYKYGRQTILLGETTLVVKICGDQFKFLGDRASVVGDPAQPTPLGGNPDDYVWIPPQTLPPEVHGATFAPGPVTGVDGIRIWHDIYLWDLVPPTQRQRCRIVARYRMARIRRTFSRDGEPVGDPVTIYMEPPLYHDVVWEIPGCR
jgi:hypothetical protein